MLFYHPPWRFKNKTQGTKVERLPSRLGHGSGVGQPYLGQVRARTGPQLAVIGEVKALLSPYQRLRRKQ